MENNSKPMTMLDMDSVVLCALIYNRVVLRGETPTVKDVEILLGILDRLDRRAVRLVKALNT